MALAFIADGSVTEYPIGAVEVRRRYPQVSFPSDLENGDFTEFGVATIHSVAQPSFDFRTERLEEGTPTFDGSQWNQNWDVVALTPEQQQQITDNKAGSIRADRNKRLADCDWSQLPDSPLDADTKAAWATYRGELRAVPEQAGFPWDVQWPSQPA